LLRAAQHAAQHALFLCDSLWCVKKAFGTLQIPVTLLLNHGTDLGGMCHEDTQVTTQGMGQYAPPPQEVWPILVAEFFVLDCDVSGGNKWFHPEGTVIKFAPLILLVLIVFVQYSNTCTDILYTV
jgi:hypothetical protein